MRAGEFVPQCMGLRHSLTSMKGKGFRVVKGRRENIAKRLQTVSACKAQIVGDGREPPSKQGIANQIPKHVADAGVGGNNAAGQTVFFKLAADARKGNSEILHVAA